MLHWPARRHASSLLVKGKAISSFLDEGEPRKSISATFISISLCPVREQEHGK